MGLDGKIVTPPNDAGETLALTEMNLFGGKREHSFKSARLTITRQN